MKVKVTKPVVFSKYGLHVEVAQYFDNNSKQKFIDDKSSDKDYSEDEWENKHGKPATLRILDTNASTHFVDQKDGNNSLNTQSRQEIEDEIYARINRYGSAINDRDPDYYEGRTDRPNDYARPYVKQQKEDIETLSDEDEMSKKAQERSNAKKKAYVSAIKHFYLTVDAIRDSIIRDCENLLHLKLVQSDPKAAVIASEERKRTIKDLEDKLYLKGNYASLRNKPQPSLRSVDSLVANVVLLEMVMQGAKGSDQIIVAFMKRNRMQGYMKHIGTAIELIAIVPFLAPAARAASLSLRTVQGFISKIAVEMAQKKVNKHLKTNSLISNAAEYGFRKAGEVATNIPTQDLPTRTLNPQLPEDSVDITPSHTDSSMYQKKSIVGDTFYSSSNDQRLQYFKEHGLSIEALKKQYTNEIWEGINEAYEAVLNTISSQDKSATPELSYKNASIEE